MGAQVAASDPRLLHPDAGRAAVGCTVGRFVVIMTGELSIFGRAPRDG